MGWILFLHFRVTNSKLKKKVLPLVTNSMIQFFFHLQVPISKLKNEKIHFELLLRKMKEQNFEW